jgi:ABC-2 type transport system permease protein
VFLGKIQGVDLVWGLGIELFWVLFFFVVSRTAFYYGTKRYSGYGG